MVPHRLLPLMLVMLAAAGLAAPEEPKPPADAVGVDLSEQQLRAVQPSNEFDLAERRQHWCYQPVQPVAVPAVRNADWPTSPIDRFILAKLEAAGLSPAPPADKRTLIRRVTFDLIGLPPTPDEVEAFVADDSPGALERVVDRLLASPHYGERWARHWLDLVRYAETLGHEFDYDIFNAWRYRDYVIRAFNADVPYDQFVIEQIAGDLRPEPRRHPTEGYNESVIGTGFFWLGEGTHSPVDIRQEQAERMDNQLDVLGKTFLAQTIGCARCHDHKFDAISTRDYYALVGYLKSSRYQQAFLDPPDRIAAKAEQLAGIRAQVRGAAAALAVEANRSQPVARYLLAAREVLRAGPNSEPAAAVAARAGLDAKHLELWVRSQRSKEVEAAPHPLYVWTQLAALSNPSADAFRSRRDALRRTLTDELGRAQQAVGRSVLFEDFSTADFSRWFVAGVAFAGGPSRPGDVVLAATADSPVARVLPGGLAHSGLRSNRLEGALQSESFTIEKRYIHLRMAGRASHVNLVIDRFPLIRDPIYGRLTIDANDESLRWRTVDLDMWRGHRCHIELHDSTTPNLTKPMPADAAGKPGDGYVVVDEIRCSDDSSPPPEPPNRLNVAVLGGRPPDSIEALAERYQSLIEQALAHWRAGDTQAADDANDAVAVVNWLWQNRLLGDWRLAPGDELRRLLEQYRAVEGTIAAPTRAPALADGSGEDEHVFRRGNYRTPGDPAPRRFLEVLAGPDQPAPKRGSGRLELARRVADPTNPLTARVMVNRIWQHHFGRGIVATPDDFGRMGELPTHPELLDYLAAEFVRSGWSIKAMHRLILLNSTYRLSGRADTDAERADPQQKLLQHMPVRRLEAEAIRDAILAVSGRLDRQMFGPSVAPHLTAFMEGRGRPAQSGPLDGGGRRSIYINVRRNFLTPMFLAFDYPVPFSTIGRRTVSNVPAQALTLMNSPLVLEQARGWGQHIAADASTPVAARITRMYEAAFARPPTAIELDEAIAFLQEQAKQYPDDPGQAKAWGDLGHVLINVKEFVFVN